MPLTPTPPVLVVDDDPVMRLVISEILEGAGMGVLVASSADEALATLDQQAVAAIITDVVMPGTLDGLGLVSTIRHRWPHVRIVVTSGRMTAEAAGNAANTAFLQKPFTELALWEALFADQVVPATAA